jgi:hypothetical protein
MSQISCHGCPAFAVSCQLPCLSSPVLSIIRLSSSLFPVLTYYPDCPLWLSCPGGLSWLSYPGCPVALLSSPKTLVPPLLLPVSVKLSCRGCHVHSFLSRLHCQGRPVMDLSLLSYPNSSGPDVHLYHYNVPIN